MSIKTSQTLVSEAMQEVKTISADDAYKLLEENNCNIIDIRDKTELDQTGTLENSINISRGLLEFQLDPNSALIQNGIIDLNKETVLFCAAGGRSALAAKTLNEMGYKKVSHIQGGFAALKNSKFKIKK
tara:strand:+ start:1155 stop:1541 length:387 start_codon:yes stop_codon:yes gene_type:complete